MIKEVTSLLKLSLLLCLPAVATAIGCVTFIEVNGVTPRTPVRETVSNMQLDACQRKCLNDMRCTAVGWDRSTRMCNVFFARVNQVASNMTTASLYQVTRNSLFCPDGWVCPEFNTWGENKNQAVLQNLLLELHQDVNNDAVSCGDKAIAQSIKDFVYDYGSRKCYLYSAQGVLGAYVFTNLAIAYPQSSLSGCSFSPFTRRTPPPPRTPQTPKTPKTPSTLKTVDTTITVSTLSTAKVDTEITSAASTAFQTSMGTDTQMTSAADSSLTSNKRTPLTPVTPQRRIGSLNSNNFITAIDPTYVVIIALGIACVLLTIIAICALCQGKLGGGGGGRGSMSSRGGSGGGYDGSTFGGTGYGGAYGNNENDGDGYGEKKVGGANNRGSDGGGGSDRGGGGSIRSNLGSDGGNGGGGGSDAGGGGSNGGGGGSNGGGGGSGRSSPVSKNSYNDDATIPMDEYRAEE